MRTIEGFRQWFAQSEPSEWISQAIALVGAVLGVTSFLYKEWIAPATAPVNIDLKTELRPLQAEKQGESNLSSVVLRTTVTNPGSRKIDLVKPYWILLGRRSGSSQSDDGTFYSYDKKMADVYNTNIMSMLEDIVSYPDFAIPTAQSTNSRLPPSGVVEPAWELIALGPLFSTTRLDGHQTVSSEKVLFFNAKRYDTVDARVTIPSIPSSPKRISTGDLTKLSRIRKLKLDDKNIMMTLESRWCFLPIIGKLVKPDSPDGKPGQLTPHDIMSLSGLERYPSGEQNDKSETRFCPRKFDELMPLPLKRDNEMRPSPADLGAQNFATQQQSPVQSMKRIIQ